MIEQQWLSDRLCAVLRWQLANPGMAPDDPTAPDIPWAGARVWGMFLELNRTRASGGFGPSPINHHEIEAWAHIRREPVRPWESDIIKELDALFLEVANRHDDASAGRRVTQSRPMSPELFDAVFSA